MDIISENYESYAPMGVSLVNLVIVWIQNCSNSLFALESSILITLYQPISYFMENQLPGVAVKTTKAFTSFFTMIKSDTALIITFLMDYFTSGFERVFMLLTYSVHKYVFTEEEQLIRWILALTLGNNTLPIITHQLIKIFSVSTQRSPCFFGGFGEFLLAKLAISRS